MYAVIRTGGKQYRVAEGDVVRIEKVPGEVGTEITFAEVLWLAGRSPRRPAVRWSRERRWWGRSSPRTATAASCTSGRRRKAGPAGRDIGSPTPK